MNRDRILMRFIDRERESDGSYKDHCFLYSYLDFKIFILKSFIQHPEDIFRHEWEEHIV